MTAQQQPPTGADLVAASPSSAPPGFFARASTARILPFAIYIAFIAIADGAARLGMSEQGLRLLYPVKIAAVLIALLVYRRHYVELVWRVMSARVAALSAAVGVVVLILWIQLDADWMQIGASAGFDPTDSAGRINWWLVAVRIAGAALVVPVMEELFWRSFLMRWLEAREFLGVHPARVGFVALATTVVLFGIEHNLWFAGIVAGAAYSALYMRTGTLWAPVLAHAVTNGLLGVWIVGTGSWSYW